MTRRQNRRSHRRGAILAAALLAFLAATAILFAVLQSVISHHRQLFIQRDQLQAQWLAQAGLDRAAAALRKSNAYQGETWQIPAEENDGASSAKVEIVVESIPDHPSDRRISVQAEYPDDPIHRVQQSRQIIVHLK